jgi:hypothetical protein
LIKLHAWLAYPANGGDKGLAPQLAVQRRRLGTEVVCQPPVESARAIPFEASESESQSGPTSESQKSNTGPGFCQGNRVKKGVTKG